MSVASFEIYCNQLYTVEEKTGLLKKSEIRYLHRVMDQYPYVLHNGAVNTSLFGEIMNAAAPFFYSESIPGLAGELWTLIKDPANNCQWGLFICTSQHNYHGNNVVLNYALCPLKYIHDASREEIVSAILRSNMIRQWGAVNIPSRLSRISAANYRSEALLNELIGSRSAQLVYGNVNQFEVTAWMEQIWCKIQETGKTVSSFYAYGDYNLEAFLHNRAILPQLLLFPGDPFKELVRAKWRKKLPLRGNPRVQATMISISSPIKSTNDYGICLVPKELSARFTSLKDVPKILGNSIQLKHSNLDDLIAMEDHSAEVNTTPQQPQCFFLLHVRTNKRYPIEKDPFWIGREKDLECTVESGAVSRKHAVISTRMDGYYIQDQSTNGTLLNGTPLSQGSAVRLEDNAQIVIGNEAFVFMSE